MANLVLSRSDLFPVGTSVGAYPAGAAPPSHDGPPAGAALESQTVASNGTATFTTLSNDTAYVFAATVGGASRKVQARLSDSVAARGRAVGTANTTNGSAALASVAASAGAFVIGQRITGPGIPPGTVLISGSGASWTMSDKATATATGVAVEAYGASRWQARLMARRAALGTT